jgi:hypothetical protein
VVGFVALLLAVNGITNRRRLAVAIATAVTSAAVVGALAILEYAGVPAVLTWLDGFRDGVRVVGGQLRASATLQYPTITSMYLEVAFALALGACLACVDRRAWARTAALLFALALIAEGVILTFTRAGLVTMATSLVLVGVWRYVRQGVDRGLGVVGAVAALVAVLVVSSASGEKIRLRLTTEGQGDWYRAAFQNPPTLSLATGSANVVEVTVINKGRVTWDADAEPPFHVSYHWLDADSDRVVVYDGLRTPLPRAVPPGDSLRIPVLVRAPGIAGRYRLGWDVVQEGRLWFSTEQGARLAVTRATISGSPQPDQPLPPRSPVFLPAPVVRVGRTTLWRAALRMFAAHPILGVGPDNFRRSYGPYAGVANADPRVHSNNMYLEALACSGVAGTVPFLWLIWRARGAMRDGRRAADRTVPLALQSGLAAAALAMLVHGLVDSFLTFTPTYLLMSLTIGLAMAPGTWTEAADAHRV